MANQAPALVQIREATPEDNVLLSQLGSQTFFETFAADNTAADMELYLRRNFSPAIQASELADPASLFLIAEAGSEPVGYAMLRRGAPSVSLDGSRPVEIVRLYARRDWIGRKVGAALMQACLEQAAARRNDTIWLDVWEKNSRAIVFYKRWGFVEVGSQPFRLGEDIQNDLIMARPVQPATHAT